MSGALWKRGVELFVASRRRSPQFPRSPSQPRGFERDTYGVAKFNLSMGETAMRITVTNVR